MGDCFKRDLESVEEWEKTEELEGTARERSERKDNGKGNHGQLTTVMPTK